MAAIDFKSVPSNVPLTPEYVARIAARAVEVAAAFRARIDNLQTQVDDAKQRFTTEANADILNTSPADRDTARRLFKKRAADKLIAFRQNIVPASKAAREELLTQLSRVAAEARFLLSVCQSPAQMLGRVALGEAKRTNYQQQLNGAGPVELESAAALAISSGDVVLAAAVVTVIDRMPLNRRPFSVVAFAERMWGEQFRDVNGKLQGVILAERKALAANNEFVRGKGDALVNLSNTLAERALAAASGEGDDDQEDAA